MLKIFSPYDGKLIEELDYHDETAVEKALITAEHLFNDRAHNLGKSQRISILEKCIYLMEERKVSLIRTAVLEGGKPWKDSEIEINRAINGVKLAIQTIETLHGEQIPMGHTPSSLNRLAFTQYEPLGVVVSISAFNHPLNLIIHQTVTAIAAGCPVIIKPALTTPLSCLAFVDILKEAGLPEGWCQAIICKDSLAEKLATDSRIAYLSFIGSAKVGWDLRSKLAPGVNCTLEHGGAAPVIVEKDADLDELIPLLAKGAFYHAGQVCVSVQRVYVHDSISDEVTACLIKEAQKMKVGDPLDPTSDIGPLILNRETDRVESWVKQAIQTGATLMCGGKRISDSCFEATVLLNPPDDAWVSTQEIFGPVVCIYSYASLEEAIEKANALPYSFQASIFTKNIDTALSVSQHLKGTTVLINDHTAFRVDWMPFGGGEHSGMGVGGIQYSIKEMMREKLVVIKSKGIV